MIAYLPTAKAQRLGLRHLKTVETEAVRKLYFAQSQSEDLLAVTFQPRVLDGRPQMCLVRTDLLAPSRG